MKLNAIVTGRLLLMALLVLIRWICQLPFFILVAVCTFFETLIGGCTNLINQLKKLNDELFAKAK